MFEIAAHKGGNSWAGIFEAEKKGYDYVELDVHLSADGYLIVQYSPVVQIEEDTLYIQDLQYASLSPENKSRLLLLSDVLAYAKDRIGIVVDIKKGREFYKNIGPKVAEMVKQSDMFHHTWLISFDHQCLAEAKKCVPEIQIALMYVARPYDEGTYWKQANADGVEVCNDYLVHETVALAHAEHLKMLGWCTTKTEELKWLVDLGIDVITIEQDDHDLNYLRALGRRGQ